MKPDKLPQKGATHTETRLYTKLQGNSKTLWEDLLAKAGLSAEDMPEQTVLIFDGDTPVATGSRQGNLLKYIAVDDARQGEGLTATVLTTLKQEAFREGYAHLFLYTKPANRYLFESLFFYPVAQTDTVLLMESQKGGIANLLDRLPVCHTAEPVGALVMNCDPFTRGHRYLIETAAKECGHVYVFVLSEDKGFFSAHHRLEMVKRGVKDLPNVTVYSTGPYLISSATFPTYFLKDRDKAETVHCALDIEIFTKYFAPKFSVTRRYVGTEPLSAMTAGYNRALEARLPQKGIALHQIPRLETAGTPISASHVRRLIAAKDLPGLKALLPESTLSYLSENHLL